MSSLSRARADTQARRQSRFKNTPQKKEQKSAFLTSFCPRSKTNHQKLRLGLHVREPAPKQRPRVLKPPRIEFPEDRVITSILARRPEVSIES